MNSTDKVVRSPSFRSILVTGGAGYIGSILVPTLLREGFRVTVLDNFRYRQTPLLDSCFDSNLNIIRGDTRDASVLKPLVREADVIIPLACLVGAPICQSDPVGAKTTNLDAIRLILDLKGADQVILFPTTNSGYGIGEAGRFCTEETPLRPISLYGRLKVEAESSVLEGENAITLRLATVFGLSPRMRLDLLVNDFTYRAVRDHFIVVFEGHFKRNYIHVRDVAQAFLHCLNHFQEMRDEPYNVGLSQANLSKLELCEVIRSVVPDLYFFESKIGEDPDKRDYLVSNEKIERTGFRPQVSLEAGIREMVKGFQVIRHGNHSNF